MRTHVLTGGAGFIGANLARTLIDRGDTVIVLDNLCRGRREHIEDLGAQGRATFYHVNVDNETENSAAWQQIAKVSRPDEVWHLAANSDIPAGVNDPAVDLRDTFMTTFNTLQMMKHHDVKVLRFASTSAVYGERVAAAFSERDATIPISNYGAMKLASEAMIRAATESFLERADIFRFPNVVGLPATHGVILDFVRKLHFDPSRLDVLGNGKQRKPYLHVSELVGAMMFIAANSPEKFGVYNIGPEDEGVLVSSIAEIVRDTVEPKASIVFGKEDRGWIGDVPQFSYSITKLAELGWHPQYGSEAAIRRATTEISAREAELNGKR
jgi:UDP-glucose 4-epimerase